LNAESIRQQAAPDALEEALLQALRWFDLPLSAAALRARAAKLPGPWSLGDVCEAAESLGLRAQRQHVPVPQAQLAALPVLLGLEGGGMLWVTAQPDEHHWQAWVPGQGMQTVQAQTWLPRLNGEQVVLSRQARIDRGADAEPQGRYGHWFWGPLGMARQLYVQVGIAALLTNLFALTTSIFSMIVYDRVIPNNAQDTLVALLIGVVVVFLSDFVIRSLRGYFLDVAGARADMVIGDTLFEQILDMQMKARRGSTGALANVLKEFESLREFLTSATLTTLIDIPFSILFLVVIYAIGGPMVIVPLLAIPLMLGASLVVQPRLKRLIQSTYEDGNRKQTILVETIGGLETVKALGAGAVMRRRWQEAVTHQSEIGLQSRMLSQFAGNIANLAQQLVQVGVVTMGFFLVAEGQIGFGAIIACTILSGRAISPLAQFSQLLTRVNQSLASYKALRQLMAAPREHGPNVQFVARDKLQGRIEFREVTFSYPDAAAPALDKVSFTIEPGERVAILGRIGSGKTTIAKLILGLYQPDKGAVLIDGIDVRQIDPIDLRRHLGVVLQEVWLMSGTVRQNIAMGHDASSDADILRAAQVAGVEDFISQHPHGYGLRVGERGEGLSGGQRQAISIARALVGNPAMLVLDEPSSAMDVGAEQTLVQRLRSVVEGKTLVVITHKSSMIQLVHKVIVLDKGRVLSVGTPEQVLGAPRAGGAA
jgi:ATP-binding cassette subfamily C protein LapB